MRARETERDKDNGLMPDLQRIVHRSIVSGEKHYEFIHSFTRRRQKIMCVLAAEIAVSRG